MPTGIHIPAPSISQVYEFKQMLADVHSEYQAHLALMKEFLSLHTQSLKTYREDMEAELQRRRDEEKRLHLEIAALQDQLGEAEKEQQELVEELRKALTDNQLTKAEQETLLAKIREQRWHRFGVFLGATEKI